MLRCFEPLMGWLEEQNKGREATLADLQRTSTAERDAQHLESSARALHAAASDERLVRVSGAHAR